MCYTKYVKKKDTQYKRKERCRVMKKVAMLILMLMVCSLVMYGCNTALDRVTTDKVMQEYEQAGDVRTVECVVTTANNGVVTLQDEQGWLWQIETEEYTTGDSMMAWIADNGTTDDTTDDAILYTVRVTE